MTDQDSPSRRQRIMALCGRAVIPGAALLLIGYGSWSAWKPLGPLSVGLLLWLDLSIGAGRQTPHTPTMKEQR